MKFTAIVVLGMAAAASASPRYLSRRASFTQQNGQDAVALNQKFATLTPDSACTEGEDACVQEKFAQCVGGKFVLQSCGAGTVCAALPLVNSQGTSVTCTTAADRDARIAATGATTGSQGGNNAAASPSSSSAASKSAAAPAKSSAAPAKSSAKPAKSSAAPAKSSAAPAKSSAAPAKSAAAPSKSATANASKGSAAPSNNAASSSDNAQTSLTLDPKAIQSNYASDGQANTTAGQVPSLTSTNNFINFCLQFPNVPQTNGQQVLDGSCNATPMGVIAAKSKMPSARFLNPINGATIPANKDFNLTVQINNMDLGHFTNPDTTFHQAPQQVNAQGLIIGHTHVTVQKLKSLNQTEAADPTTFAFFKGLNDVGVNGRLTTLIAGGLAPGVYRAATITAAANHQPVLVAVAQRGTVDDMSYFTVV